MVTRQDLLRALQKGRIEHRIQEHGSGWMIVAPTLAARIMGLGIGDENALWVAPHVKRAPWSRGGNAGGLRTWLAPEAGPNGFFFDAEGRAWDCQPALDPGNYAEVSAEKGWLAFRSEMAVRTASGQEYQLAITRSMTVDDSAAADGRRLRVRLVQALENIGCAAIDKRIGLWAIAQLPGDKGGTILIPTRQGAAGGTAGMGAAHPCYQPPPAGVLREDCGCVFLQTGGVGMYKVGVAAAQAAGSIASLRPSRLAHPQAAGQRAAGPQAWVLTVMRFSVDASAAYVDKPSYGLAPALEGDAVQAYNDAGRDKMAFCEIEAHAPAAALPPGGRQEHEIELTVARGTAAAMTEVLRETTGISLTL